MAPVGEKKEHLAHANKRRLHMGPHKTSGAGRQADPLDCDGAALVKRHPTHNTAGRVKAPAKGGDIRFHGLLTNQPGTNTVREGMRSWQNVSDGSMRPFVNGWRSDRGAVLRSHSMQGSAVLSRASTWPLQRAMSWGSVMSSSPRPVVVRCFLHHAPTGVEGVARSACPQISAESNERHATASSDGRPAMEAVGVHLGGFLSDFGGAFELDQLRPDQPPVIRAQVPTAHRVIAFALDDYSEFRARFALSVVDRLPRCKLVEVDGANADLCSERRHAAVWQ